MLPNSNRSLGGFFESCLGRKERNFFWEDETTVSFARVCFVTLPKDIPNEGTVQCASRAHASFS